MPRDLRPLLLEVERRGHHDGIDVGQTVFRKKTGTPTYVVGYSDDIYSIITPSYVRVPFLSLSEADIQARIGACFGACATHEDNPVVRPTAAEAMAFLAGVNHSSTSILCAAEHEEEVLPLAGNHTIYVAEEFAPQYILLVPRPSLAGYIARHPDGRTGIVVGHMGPFRTVRVEAWTPILGPLQATLPEILPEIPPPPEPELERLPSWLLLGDRRAGRRRPM